jgi:hypothetical protein
MSEQVTVKIVELLEIWTKVEWGEIAMNAQ